MVSWLPAVTTCWLTRSLDGPIPTPGAVVARWPQYRRRHRVPGALPLGHAAAMCCPTPAGGSDDITLADPASCGGGEAVGADAKPQGGSTAGAAPQPASAPGMPGRPDRCRRQLPHPAAGAGLPPTPERLCGPDLPARAVPATRGQVVAVVARAQGSRRRREGKASPMSHPPPCPAWSRLLPRRGSCAATRAGTRRAV